MNALTVEFGRDRSCCETRRAGRVIFLTALFPLGSDEQWKYGQLNALAERFEEVIVIPFGGGSISPWTGPLPSNVSIRPPLRPLNQRYRRTLVAGVLNMAAIMPFVRDFFRRSVWRRRAWLREWWYTMLTARSAARRKQFMEVVRSIRAGDVVCSYWGFAGAYLLPLVRWPDGVAIAVRLHRGDVFEDDVGGYLPLRHAIYGRADVLSAASDAARNYIVSHYPDCAEKILVNRLGTPVGHRSPTRSDGVFRIVSCSLLVPVKRVNLIALALRRVIFPVEWMHIGDGPLRGELERLCQSLPSNVRTQLTGQLPSAQVSKLLESSGANVFINVSFSEGVPISIMEALMAGIPVIATNVGGTAEILRETFAFILDRNVNEETLADAISRFRSLSFEQQSQMSDAAANFARNYCDAAVLDEEFAELLAKLAHSAQTKSKS